MCAFTSLPLWDAVLSIWDTFMLKGAFFETQGPRKLKCLPCLPGVACFHRFGLAILAICGDELMDAGSIAEMLPYLHHLPPSRVSYDGQKCWHDTRISSFHQRSPARGCWPSSTPLTRWSLRRTAALCSWPWSRACSRPTSSPPFGRVRWRPSQGMDCASHPRYSHTQRNKLRSAARARRKAPRTRRGSWPTCRRRPPCSSAGSPCWPLPFG